MDRQSRGNPNLVEELRERFFAALANFVDKGYRYVRIKEEITIQQANYLRSYEDLFLLEFLGMFSTFISSYYIYLVYKYRNNMKNLPRLTAVKGATFFAMGIASTISAYMIDSKERVFQKTEFYSQEFDQMVKEAQQSQFQIRSL